MPQFPQTRAAMFLAASLALFFSPSIAVAQDGSMKACGEKWQAAKAANATNGATWPKFLAECRAALVATPAPAPSVAAAVPQPAKAPEAPAAPKPLAAPVFPTSVDPKFADLRPTQARQKTCSVQYQANKAKDANGGLGWSRKDGYWSQCNRKLKGA